MAECSRLGCKRLNCLFGLDDSILNSSNFPSAKSSLSSLLTPARLVPHDRLWIVLRLSEIFLLNFSKRIYYYNRIWNNCAEEHKLRCCIPALPSTRITPSQRRDGPVRLQIAEALERSPSKICASFSHGIYDIFGSYWIIFGYFVMGNVTTANGGFDFIIILHRLHERKGTCSCAYGCPHTQSHT